MKTEKTTVEKYSKELEEIKKSIDLFKSGEDWDFEIMHKVKILIINVYSDGRSDGFETGRQIFSH